MITFRATLVLTVLPAVLAQTEADLQALEAARRAKQQGQTQIASKGFEAILPAFRAGKDRVQYARVLMETAQAAVAIGEYQRAILLAADAAGIFKTAGERKSEASAVNTVGLSHLYRGEYPAALEQFHRAM